MGVEEQNTRANIRHLAPAIVMKCDEMRPTYLAGASISAQRLCYLKGNLS